MTDSTATHAKSAELLAGECRAGSEAAFAELVGRFHHHLRAFLHRFAGNGHDADDLAQETFIRAFREIGRYDARRPFKPWLFAIGRNLALSELRKAGAAPLFLAPDMLPETSDGTAAPGDDIVAGETWECLRGELARLRPEQREALWLFHVEEMPLSDIARVVGKNALAVRVMLFRTRRQLARRLANPPPHARTADEKKTKIRLAPGGTTP